MYRLNKLMAVSGSLVIHARRLRASPAASGAADGWRATRPAAAELARLLGGPARDAPSRRYRQKYLTEPLPVTNAGRLRLSPPDIGGVRNGAPGQTGQPGVAAGFAQRSGGSAGPGAPDPAASQLPDMPCRQRTPTCRAPTACGVGGAGAGSNVGDEGALHPFRLGGVLKVCSISRDGELRHRAVADAHIQPQSSPLALCPAPNPRPSRWGSPLLTSSTFCQHGGGAHAPTARTPPENSSQLGVPWGLMTPPSIRSARRTGGEMLLGTTPGVSRQAQGLMVGSGWLSYSSGQQPGLSSAGLGQCPTKDLCGGAAPVIASNAMPARATARRTACSGHSGEG